jgi:hypothetical protein
VRLEGLGQLKKFNDLIGDQTRDLPTCSIVPQPTTLLRAPAGSIFNHFKGPRCDNMLPRYKHGDRRSLKILGYIYYTLYDLLSLSCMALVPTCSCALLSWSHFDKPCHNSPFTGNVAIQACVYRSCITFTRIFPNCGYVTSYVNMQSSDC